MIKLFSAFLCIGSLIIINSCGSAKADSSTGAVGGGEKGFYTIKDINGARTSSEINTNYDTLLFLPGEMRKIYYGGKIWPNPKINLIWKINYDDDVITDNIYANDIIQPNGSTSRWWQGHIDWKDREYISGDYSMNLSVGSSLDSTDFTLSEKAGEKNITLKVGEYNARDWNVDVYQQTSYNGFEPDLEMQKAINKAFFEVEAYKPTMNVNINTVVRNSDLADTVINNQGNISYNGIQYYASVPSVRYAYKYIKSRNDTLTVSETEDYILDDLHEQPNRGYLFFVMDQTNNTGEDFSNGTTISYHDPGNIYDPLPPPSGSRWGISWVYVKKINDSYSEPDSIKKKIIQATANHELGHLWCINFTDASHTHWHNGDNQNICLMDPITRTSAGYLTSNSKKMVQLGLFCEGHNQRGMNISWENDRFIPYGERLRIDGPGQGQAQKEIYASLSPGVSKSSNNDLTLEISIDSTNYFVGQYFVIILSIFNHSDKDIQIYRSQLNAEYFNITKGRKMIGDGNGSGKYATIPAHSKISNPILKDFNYYTKYPDDIYHTNLFWEASEYSIKYILFTKNGKIESNTLTINIKDIPHKWNDSFNQLVKFEKFVTEHSGSPSERKAIYSYADSLLYRNKILQNNLYINEFYIKFYKILTYDKKLMHKIKLDYIKNNPNSIYLKIVR